MENTKIIKQLKIEKVDNKVFSEGDENYMKELNKLVGKWSGK